MIKTLKLPVLLALSLAMPVIAGATGDSKSWDFSVLLDGDRIGYHRFELVEDGDRRRIKSEAKFDVRFLFINAFRYRHNATEVWTDGCLREIDTRTQANGKKLAVSGATVEDRLIIDAGASETEFDDCVMTFAYWDPDFLQEPRLLNSQSGEYVDVAVESLGVQPVMVRGQEVDASVYRLTAKKLELKLWYSPDDEWLALESVAKGGRIIRYELS
ncbi:MAG: hypothetical protein KJP16_10015 [Gammaproteobacteria bacterium]|nr:hypothetical protein [Gammaproteobacteria bacterium]NNC57785.1 hypothetical protein [Woeseiaceae bacterium]NNL51143.1 hypothetical protein [Woeseiaceae bacterium]